MRSLIFAAVVLALPVVPLHADLADQKKQGPEKQAFKVKKVVIANLAFDAARAAELEASIKSELVMKGVAADSLRNITAGEKKPANEKDLVALIQDGGYDSVLCIGVRKTMRVTAADKANDFPTLDSCLTIFLTGKYPSGQSLRSEPFVVDAMPTQRNEAANDQMANQRTPIASNQGAAPVTYFKRMMRLFDVSKKNLVWEKRMMAKLGAEMSESRQASLIAKEAVKVMDQAGLLP